MKNEQPNYPTGGTAKRAVLGTLALLINDVVSVIEQIALVPLFLIMWGEARYGDWLIVASLAGYLSISDFGMGNYVTNKMTQLYAKGDGKSYMDVVKSSTAMFAVISAALSVLLAAFAFFAPFAEWFHIGATDGDSVKMAVFILGLSGIVSSVMGIPSGLQYSVGDYARNRMFAAIKHVANVILIAAALLLHGGIVWVALSYLVLFALSSLVMFFDVMKRHPEIDLSIGNVDWKLGLSFVVPGFIFLLIPLSEMVVTQGSVLIVGAVAGSVAVATFGVHRTLANVVRRLTDTVTPALQPEIAAEEARGNCAKIAALHNLLLKATLLVSVVLAVLLWFFGGKIIALWTGGRVVFDPILWTVLMVAIPVGSVWRLGSVFQSSTNRYNKLAGVRIAAAAAGVVLALFLMRSIGLAGVALGFLAGEVLFNIWFVPEETLHIVKESKRRFARNVMLAVPLLGLEIGLVYAVSAFLHSFWPGAVVASLLTGAVGVAYAWFVWLTPDERDIVADVVRRGKLKVLKTLGK